jgi:hypothetical protein
MRTIEEVLGRYWEQFKVPLCTDCHNALRFCDQRAWQWFRKYALKHSN